MLITIPEADKNISIYPSDKIHGTIENFGEKFPDKWSDEEILSLIAQHTRGIWDYDHFINQWPSIVQNDNLQSVDLLGIYKSEKDHHQPAMGINNLFHQLCNQTPELNIEFTTSHGKFDLKSLLKPVIRIEPEENLSGLALSYTRQQITQCMKEQNKAFVFCIPDRVFQYPGQWQIPVTTSEFFYILRYIEELHSQGLLQEKPDAKLPVYFVCGSDQVNVYHP